MPPPEPPAAAAVAGGAPEPAPLPETVARANDPQPDSQPDPGTFDEVVALTEERKEAILHANLINNVHLVHFEPGRIEFRLTEHADSSLAPKLSKFLGEETSRRWMVTISNEPGAATLHQRQDESIAKTKAEAAKHPLVKEILETFPGATIQQVRDIGDED